MTPCCLPGVLRRGMDDGYLPSRRLTFLMSAVEATTSAARRRVRVLGLDLEQVATVGLLAQDLAACRSRGPASWCRCASCSSASSCRPPRSSAASARASCAGVARWCRASVRPVCAGGVAGCAALGGLVPALLVLGVRSAIGAAARPRRAALSAAARRAPRPSSSSGPSTMIMLRPSCLGADSTNPSSCDVLGQPLQQPEAELGPGLLATAEHDRDLDLVARLEEPHDVTLLGLVVVRVDLRPELHLLDDRVDLVLAAPRGPSCARLVLELAVVHELADRRAGHRGHLDQVEVCLLRPAAGRPRCGRCRPARRWGRRVAPRGRGSGR